MLFCRCQLSSIIIDVMLHFSMNLIWFRVVSQDLLFVRRLFDRHHSYERRLFIWHEKNENIYINIDSSAHVINIRREKHSCRTKIRCKCMFSNPTLFDSHFDAPFIFASFSLIEIGSFSIRWWRHIWLVQEWLEHTSYVLHVVYTQVYLNRCENSWDIIGRRPTILKNIETYTSISID
jgi:hypothetical protein